MVVYRKTFLPHGSEGWKSKVASLGCSHCGSRWTLQRRICSLLLAASAGGWHSLVCDSITPPTPWLITLPLFSYDNAPSAFTFSGRHGVALRAHPHNPGSPSHLKILNFATSAKSVSVYDRFQGQGVDLFGGLTIQPATLCFHHPCQNPKHLPWLLALRWPGPSPPLRSHLAPYSPSASPPSSSAFRFSSKYVPAAEPWSLQFLLLGKLLLLASFNKWKEVCDQEKISVFYVRVSLKVHQMPENV